MSEAEINPRIAVTDVARAREFYERRLGLSGHLKGQFDEPARTYAEGIHDTGYSKIAWIKDPDGNTFELSQAY